MKTLINRFVKDESGATAIEYGLIAGLVSVVIIAAVTTAGTRAQCSVDQHWYCAVDGPHDALIG